MRSISFIGSAVGIAVIAFVAPSPVVAQTDVINIVGDKVGILTAAPDASLHVMQPPGVGGATLLVQEGALEVKRTDGASANFRYRVANPTITQSWLFMLNGSSGGLEFRNETSRVSPLIINASAPTASFFASSGGVGIGRVSPTYPLHMGSGAHVTAGGVWTNASSRALKDGISDLSAEAAKSALEGLQPVTFHYKNSPDEQYAGFIAEDVPEVVATNDRQGLSPMDLVAVLTKVVQDQQNTIENLATRIEELELQ